MCHECSGRRFERKRLCEAHDRHHVQADGIETAVLPIKNEPAMAGPLNSLRFDFTSGDDANDGANAGGANALRSSSPSSLPGSL
jgi:hypothetical protein